MPDPKRVLVWTDAAGLHTEDRPIAYPEGIHNTIANFLNDSDTFEAVAVAVDEEPLTQESLDGFQALVVWGHGRPIKPETQTHIVRQVESGKIGVVGLHSILIFHSNPLLVASLFGQTARFGWEDHVPMRFAVAKPHPIFEGVTSFDLEDEAYYEPLGLVEGADVLLTMEVPDCEARDSNIYQQEENRYQNVRFPVAGLVTRAAWTYQVGKGRSFYLQPGHETDPTYRDPVVQGIVARAVEWVAAEEGC